MFARKRPLTRPLDPDIDHDDEPLSRSRKRRSYPGQSVFSNLVLRLNIQKDDPLTWLVGFFVTTLLLAGATLVDLDGVSGVREGGFGVTEIESASGIVGDGWKNWSLFTSPLENKTESNRSNTRRKGSLHPTLRSVSSSSIQRDNHGLRSFPLAQEKKLSEHPITTVIRDAEKKAEQLEAKIGGIKTFEDAVADYRETFGMDPPRGFRNWCVSLTFKS
jgi:hypothetical protein